MIVVTELVFNIAESAELLRRVFGCFLTTR